MKKTLLLAALGLLTLAVSTWMVLRTTSVPPPVRASTPAAAPSGVGCLGSIQPEDRVVVVTAPYYESRPTVVAELAVKEGGLVQKNQTLAVLDSRKLVESALRQSEARIAVAQQRLAQVRSGPKQADIDSLQAERGRLEASLANAETESARYASLAPSGAVSRSSAEEKALAVVTLKRSIEEVDGKIRSLSEIRPADVQAAEAEVAAASTDRQHLETLLETTVVRAPFAGRVLAIHAHEGEEIGPKGLLELARSGNLYVVAEVLEGDIGRVRIGQKATAKSALLAGPLHGVVERIGRTVGPATIDSADPLAYMDNRVIQVFIRLDDSRPAEAFIRAKVDVAIEP
jgi:HlyD family secretion protein